MLKTSGPIDVAYYLAGVLVWAAFVPLSLAQPPAEVADKVTVEVEDDGATIHIDGKLFTRYLTNSGTKPVLWPVIGPTGEAVTRAYPVSQSTKHESRDHIHHRSIWFGYEGINGVNFWHEPKNLRSFKPDFGRQQHQEFVRAESQGERAVLVTRNNYLDANGKIVAKDERTLIFGIDELPSGDARWIDYRIKLFSPDGPLTIGDTKEGAFAVRVAGTMKVDAKMGGRIVSATGEENTQAWGKQAAWVDYQGPATNGGKTVGIAMLAHPTSHSPTPRWHVRPYGLFAANPFGASDYTDGKEKGGLEVAEGEPIVLRHRIVLHHGDHKQADIAGLYNRYREAE